MKHEALGRYLDEHGLPAGLVEPLATLVDCLAQPSAPTAIHDPGQSVRVHVADSLAGLRIPELRSAGRIADLGAGAGVPGLVLAVARPDAHVSLIEANGRKCAFLRETAEAMALGNVDVVHSRAEEWTSGIGHCDVITARAVAALPVLAEYAAPLLREAGVLVAWKGEVPADEAIAAKVAAECLGLSIEAPLAVTPYAGSERRKLHVLRKTAPTPALFPRRVGVATKRPLGSRRG